jgi:polyphosphate kinase
MSENIRVVSILDRYLEHSRIIYFHGDGKELVYISSADWMPRNLIRRVELLVPIQDEGAKHRLKETLLSYARDTVKGRCLQPDGGYRRARPAKNEGPHRHQRSMYERAVQARRPTPRST